MMTPRLKSLTIQDFRSIHGSVVIPLDAQVILLHGTNGIGKTSVLSALELGLTGSISHLEDGATDYRDFLTNFDASSGSIQLTVEHLLPEHKPVIGTLDFSAGSFNANAALPDQVSSFFSERCYLPQAVLGRLLEMYDEQKKGAQSELTRFVKELLRIDPLDALVDGLAHAADVRRVRRLSPVYKQLEDLQSNYRDQLVNISSQEKTASDALDQRRLRIGEMYESLFPNEKLELSQPSIAPLRARLANRADDESMFSTLSSLRSEVIAMQSDSVNGDEKNAVDNIASLERQLYEYSQTLESWQARSGVQIDSLTSDLRMYYPDLVVSDVAIDEVVQQGLSWCTAEANRSNRLLEQHRIAEGALSKARQTIERATTRIREISSDLKAGAQDARTLAHALAGVAPHVEGDVCPVCNRDFTEIEKGSLTTHISNTIANLTAEAGRLQGLATERANESERLNKAQQEAVSAERGLLDDAAVLELKQRTSNVTSISSRLEDLREEAMIGARIERTLRAAQSSLRDAQRAARSSQSLLPEIQSAVQQITGRALASFESTSDALIETSRLLDQKIEACQQRLSLRVSIASELDQFERESAVFHDWRSRSNDITKRVDALGRTITDINSVRHRAKQIATAASEVRSGIVGDVFSGSLNRVWRDLFVRLAPSEQFVPQFKLPPSDGGKVEAVLETVHRSGRSAGAPGAMLSQGNLNTAALTLFLALNISVPNQLPWLVLDDPVQSMDDVHIAQFAALLRTLSKQMGKQVILAVHERALFDYLALELSPAFPGDSLITVELSRDRGRTVADPNFLQYKDDRAVAA